VTRCSGVLHGYVPPAANEGCRDRVCGRLLGGMVGMGGTCTPMEQVEGAEGIMMWR
jgi:hypothetical protein